MNTLLKDREFMSKFEQSKAAAIAQAQQDASLLVEGIYDQMFIDLQDWTNAKRSSFKENGNRHQKQLNLHQFQPYIIETTGTSEILSKPSSSFIEPEIKFKTIEPKQVMQLANVKKEFETEEIVNLEPPPTSPPPSSESSDSREYIEIDSDEDEDVVDDIFGGEDDDQDFDGELMMDTQDSLDTSNGNGNGSTQMANIHEQEENNANVPGFRLAHKMIPNLKYDFRCDECGLRYKTENDLEIHRTIHTQPNALECPKCSQKFKNIQALNRHTPYCQVEPQFGCEQCGKKFSRSYLLKVHMLCHTRERPYTCDICGQAFIRQSTRKNHIRAIHQNIRPYRCTFPGCDFTGTIKSNVMQHVGARHFGITQRVQRQSDFMSKFGDMSKYIQKVSSTRVHGASKRTNPTKFPDNQMAPSGSSSSGNIQSQMNSQPTNFGNE